MWSRFWSTFFDVFLEKNTKTRKMKKQLSYYKIQCFVRVAMLKKTSAAVRNTPFFFHLFSFVFSWKIDGKSCKKRENRVCAQKSTKERVWNDLFQQQFNFQLIFGDLLGCQGQPGTSRERSKIVIFHMYSQFRRKTGPDGPLEGSRQSPGVPQAPTGYHFKSIV